MRIRKTVLTGTLAIAALVGVLAAGPAAAAIYKGRRVDGRWYEGRVISTTFGAYECQVRFDGDRALIRLPATGLQITGFLEDEVITDPHDITVEDPRRGVYWTLNVFNLGS